MTAGDRVEFTVSGRRTVGEIAEVLTAGRAGQSGIHRRRERVRLHYTEAGEEWETLRDLDEVYHVQPAQGELFGELSGYSGSFGLR